MAPGFGSTNSGQHSFNRDPAILSEMLRVLLKAKTEHLGVAAKLVASASDLDAMAAGETWTCCAVGGQRCSGMRQSACARAKSALSPRDALSQPLKKIPCDIPGAIDRLFVSMITILRMPSSVPVDRNLPAVS